MDTGTGSPVNICTVIAKHREDATIYIIVDQSAFYENETLNCGSWELKGTPKPDQEILAQKVYYDTDTSCLDRVKSDCNEKAYVCVGEHPEIEERNCWNHLSSETAAQTTMSHAHTSLGRTNVPGSNSSMVNATTVGATLVEGSDPQISKLLSVVIISITVALLCIVLIAILIYRKRIQRAQKLGYQLDQVHHQIVADIETTYNATSRVQPPDPESGSHLTQGEASVVDSDDITVHPNTRRTLTSDSGDSRVTGDSVSSRDSRCTKDQIQLCISDLQALPEHMASYDMALDAQGAIGTGGTGAVPVAHESIKHKLPSFPEQIAPYDMNLDAQGAIGSGGTEAVPVAYESIKLTDANDPFVTSPGLPPCENEENPNVTDVPLQHLYEDILLKKQESLPQSNLYHAIPNRTQHEAVVESEMKDNPLYQSLK